MARRSARLSRGPWGGRVWPSVARAVCSAEIAERTCLCGRVSIHVLSQVLHQMFRLPLEPPPCAPFSGLYIWGRHSRRATMHRPYIYQTDNETAKPMGRSIGVLVVCWKVVGGPLSHPTSQVPSEHVWFEVGFEVGLVAFSDAFCRAFCAVVRCVPQPSERLMPTCCGLWCTAMSGMHGRACITRQRPAETAGWQVGGGRDSRAGGCP